MATKTIAKNMQSSGRKEYLIKWLISNGIWRRNFATASRITPEKQKIETKAVALNQQTSFLRVEVIKLPSPTTTLTKMISTHK